MIQPINWTVSKRPLFAQVDGAWKPIKNKVAIVRDDNSQPISIVGDGYTIFQNHELEEFSHAIIGEGAAKLENAYVWRDGRKVALQFSFPTYFNVGGADDKIQQYLTLINGHDGLTSLYGMVTAFRLNCSNKIMWMIAKMKSSMKIGNVIRIRHTASIHDKVVEARKVLGFASESFEEVQPVLQRLAATPLTNVLHKQYINRVLDIEAVRPQDMSSRIINMQRSIHNLGVLGRGNNGKTLWDAYNGVTEYVDHYQFRNRNNRTEAINIGSGADLKVRALQVADAMAL